MPIDDWLPSAVRAAAIERALTAGEAVFRRGDPASEMFFIVSGRFHVKERNVELEPGEIFGELGLLNAVQARTAGVECTASGELLRMSYEQVKQLCLQDSKFSFYFLHFVSKRLFHNLTLAEPPAPLLD